MGSAVKRMTLEIDRGGLAAVERAGWVVVPQPSRTATASAQPSGANRLGANALASFKRLTPCVILCRIRISVPVRLFVACLDIP